LILQSRALTSFPRTNWHSKKGEINLREITATNQQKGISDLSYFLIGYFSIFSLLI
jgi:hypothetical protein